MTVSNVFVSLRVSGFILLLFTCLGARAQSEDWHMSSRDLFVKSAFAHGYMHGYEQGFHNGDIDLQMGRDFRDVKNQAEFKKMTGFRSEYGDKKLFEDGYRVGFLVGYTDCFAGRSFRAVQLLAKTAQSPSAAASAHFDRSFDHAFREGYETGQRQGLADGRVSAAWRANSPCEPGGELGDITPQYCDAFRDGYRLGYSDGFANQHDSGEILARNRGK
jgi:hypothetical protein